MPYGYILLIGEQMNYNRNELIVKIKNACVIAAFQIKEKGDEPKLYKLLRDVSAYYNVDLHEGEVSTLHAIISAELLRLSKF